MRIYHTRCIALVAALSLTMTSSWACSATKGSEQTAKAAPAIASQLGTLFSALTALGASLWATHRVGERNVAISEAVLQEIQRKNLEIAAQNLSLADLGIQINGRSVLIAGRKLNIDEFVSGVDPKLLTAFYAGYTDPAGQIVGLSDAAAAYLTFLLDIDGNIQTALHQVFQSVIGWSVDLLNGQSVSCITLSAADYIKRGYNESLEQRASLLQSINEQSEILQDGALRVQIFAHQYDDIYQRTRFHFGQEGTQSSLTRDLDLSVPINTYCEQMCLRVGAQIYTFYAEAAGQPSSVTTIAKEQCKDARGYLVHRILGGASGGQCVTANIGSCEPCGLGSGMGASQQCSGESVGFIEAPTADELDRVIPSFGNLVDTETVLHSYAESQPSSAVNVSFPNSPEITGSAPIDSLPNGPVSTTISNPLLENFQENQASEMEQMRLAMCERGGRVLGEKIAEYFQTESPYGIREEEDPNALFKAENATPAASALEVYINKLDILPQNVSCRLEWEGNSAESSQSMGQRALTGWRNLVRRGVNVINDLHNGQDRPMVHDGKPELLYAICSPAGGSLSEEYRYMIEFTNKNRFIGVERGFSFVHGCPSIK